MTMRGLLAAIVCLVLLACAASGATPPTVPSDSGPVASPNATDTELTSSVRAASPVAESAEPSSSTPLVIPSYPASAEDRAGSLRLTFQLPATTWKAGEAITGVAILDYDGLGTTELSGSGGGFFGFEIVESGGPRAIWPVWQDDCRSYLLPANEPMTTGIRLSAGWDADDPNAAFIVSVLGDPVLRLPAGEWAITAVARFIDAPGCGATEQALSATVRIIVTD